MKRSPSIYLNIKAESVSAAGVNCKHVLTRFAIKTHTPNKSARVATQATIDRIMGVLGQPEILLRSRSRTWHYSDSPGVEHTRIQESLHNAVSFVGKCRFKTCAFNNARYAMHMSIDRDNWLSLSPFVHLTHNSSSTTVQENIIPYIRFTSTITSRYDPRHSLRRKHSRCRGNNRTRDSLRIALDLTRRNWCEAKQAAKKQKVTAVPCVSS